MIFLKGLSDRLFGSRLRYRFASLADFLATASLAELTPLHFTEEEAEGSRLPCPHPPRLLASRAGSRPLLRDVLPTVCSVISRLPAVIEACVFAACRIVNPTYRKCAGIAAQHLTYPADEGAGAKPSYREGSFATAPPRQEPARKAMKAALVLMRTTMAEQLATDARHDRPEHARPGAAAMILVACAFANSMRACMLARG